MAQKKWYDRKKERPDLIEGAFEVLRFPYRLRVQAALQARPEAKRKRILNPGLLLQPVRARETDPTPCKNRASHRLMERDEPQVLDWIRQGDEEPTVHLHRRRAVQALHGPAWCQLEGVPQRPFLKEELRELGDIFPKITEKSVAPSTHTSGHTST